MVLLIDIIIEIFFGIKWILDSTILFFFPGLSGAYIIDWESSESESYESETDEDHSLLNKEFADNESMCSEVNADEQQKRINSDYCDTPSYYDNSGFTEINLEEDEEEKMRAADMGEQFDMNDDTYLNVELIHFRKGVIINGEVYLTNQQWNTLIEQSEYDFYCAVCSTTCDGLDHIDLESHKYNLLQHIPLNRFEVHIIRKIAENFHCGVCNVMFHESDIANHIYGSDHFNKMLHAVNKVSDLLEDPKTYDGPSEIYYSDAKDHFDVKAVKQDLSVSSSDDDEFNDHSDAYASLDYVEDEDEDEDVDGDHLYEKIEPVSFELSYSSIARRPKAEKLRLLNIDLDDREITVTYNSWNMIINPKPSIYYCMVCTTSGQIRDTEDHCQSEDHKVRLAECNTIPKYDMHLVRQVDDRLYHCGHCNNLQLIHDMDDHIEAKHPRNSNAETRRPSTPVRTPSKNNTHVYDKENCKNNINIQNIDIDNGSMKNEITSDGKLHFHEDVLLANDNMFEDIVICTSGKAITISKLAYNIMCAKGNDYYCGLCETMVDEDRLTDHVNSKQHIILLGKTPFLQAFNVHLFRQIRDALHCALCNVLLTPAMIATHQFDCTHEERLVEAIGDIPDETEVINDENEADKDDDTNNETNGNEDLSDDGSEENELDSDDDTNDTDSNDDADLAEKDFDFEEQVYVKIGNTCSKISNAAFNTLVPVGDGGRYCFVCASFVNEVKKHVDTRGHVQNRQKCNFVEKYKKDLLRQSYHTYHCSICNILFTRQLLNQHLIWPNHIIQANNVKATGKERNSDIKKGVAQYNVTVGKENIYLNETEPKPKIRLYVDILKDAIQVSRKNKIIMFDDNVLKISFEAWHSLKELPEGWFCSLCQRQFYPNALGKHITSECHVERLEKFDTTCSLTLTREIHDALLNCVICNSEIPNVKNITRTHAHGKKHKAAYQAILEESTSTESYSDCEDEVLQL